MQRHAVVGHVTALLFAVATFLIVSARPAAPMTTSPATQNSQGSAVYAEECAGCHGNDGEGALEGPSLRGMPPGDDVVPGVAEIVRDGYEDMDPFRDELSAEEIDAVARYVVDAFATEGAAPEGGVLYRLNCAGCHGAPGRGGALIYSDENAPSLMDVSQAEVVAASRGGPGEMPAFNQRALSDEQMASVVEYVEALQSPPGDGGLDLQYPGPVSEGFVAVVAGMGAAILGAWWVERGGRG